MFAMSVGASTLDQRSYGSGTDFDGTFSVSNSPHLLQFTVAVAPLATSLSRSGRTVRESLTYRVTDAAGLLADAASVPEIA